MKRSKQPSSRRLDLRFRHKLALETPAEASFVEKFNALAGMSDDEKLDKEFALKALRTIRDLIHERVRSESKGGISVTIPPNIRYISIPGIPDDELELEAFEAWTAGLIREAINAYAARLEITPEIAVEACMFFAGEKWNKAVKAERLAVQRRRQWKQLLKSETSHRSLLPPELLARVSRYGSSLERSFFKTLHEIQRLQAARSGHPVPVPAALDLGMTVQQAAPFEAVAPLEENKAA